MTVIEPPRGPGTIVSRWRTEGPVDSDTLMAWKDELDWPSWLSLAEAALFMDAPELLEAMQPHLSPGEEAVLGLIRRRWLGDTHLGEAIEAALTVVRNPDTRDLALEGRLRMERGLFRFEAGDAEGAEDDLTWAETRLKSVAKASRDHDLSLLNKAAYHMAQGEALMALQVYGDISRTAGHAHETIAISRLASERVAFVMDWAICLMPVGTHGTRTSTPSWPFNTRWPLKRGPCSWTWRLAINQQTLHRCTSKWRKRNPSTSRMNPQRFQSTPMTSTASSTGAWNTSKKAGAGPSALRFAPC